MWNCGGSSLSLLTRGPPRPTCTKIATSTIVVNHHSARVRSATTLWAASAHTPARPLPMMTNHAQPLWRSSRRSPSSSALRGGERRPSGLGLRVGLGGRVDEIDDLLVGEAGERAERAGEVDRVLVLLAAEAAEAEQLVDGALEVERRLLRLGVLRREAAQPVGSHLHVGDLVGEHPVLAEVEHRVAGRLAEPLHRV